MPGKTNGHGMSWRSTEPYPSRYEHPEGSPESVRKGLLADIAHSYFWGGSAGDLGWMDEAACVGTDPEAFFPATGSNSTMAKKVCAGCPVREPCTEFGAPARYGLFGGAPRGQRPGTGGTGTASGNLERVRELSARGVSTEAIATRLGITRNSVKRLARQARQQDAEATQREADGEAAA